MDYSAYVGKKVKVECLNNIYYIGLVLEADRDSILLNDKNGMKVTLKDYYILSVREVSF